MCCICFEMWPTWYLWQRPDGYLTDVCIPCKVNELQLLRQRDCAHERVEYVEDEYGSLADGGSYEVHRCTACDKLIYVPLPD